MPKSCGLKKESSILNALPPTRVQAASYSATSMRMHAPATPIWLRGRRARAASQRGVAHLTAQGAAARRIVSRTHFLSLTAKRAQARRERARTPRLTSCTRACDPQC